MRYLLANRSPTAGPYGGLGCVAAERRGTGQCVNVRARVRCETHEVPARNVYEATQSERGLCDRRRAAATAYPLRSPSCGRTSCCVTVHWAPQPVGSKDNDKTHTSPVPH